MNVSKRNILIAGVAASAFLAFAAPAFAGGGSTGSGGTSGCTSGCGTGPAPAPLPTGRPSSGIGGGVVIGAPAIGIGGAPMGGGPGCCGGRLGSLNVAVPSIGVAAPSVNIGGGAITGGSVGVVTSGVTLNKSIVVTGEAGAVAGERQRAFFSGGGGGFGPAEAAPQSQITLPSEEKYFETITEQVPVTEQVCVPNLVSVPAMSLRPVQAVCLDDKGRPHPASQVNKSEKISGKYTGEIYRCMAGTSMQVTMGSYDGKASSFAKGETFSCQKGEALIYSASAGLSCAKQADARDCNERSLLRKYGPGPKLVEMKTTTPACTMTTRTTYQTRTRQVERIRQLPNRPMVLTGGVGNGVQ